MGRKIARIAFSSLQAKLFSDNHYGTHPDPVSLRVNAEHLNRKPQLFDCGFFKSVQERFMPSTSSSKAAAVHPPAHAAAAKTAAKTAAPAPTATMFGVAISTAPAHSIAEKPEMSQKKKR